MRNLYKESQARKFKKDPLAMRVYTSRLLGQDQNLVMHGGGNTSVKAEVKNAYGEKESILYVKGSGWDLATIEAEGFAPVRMDALLKMAQFKKLSDTEMVRLQRAAMLDPYAPNPSVEAILHAIIPFKFVDHTHADAVVTLTNTPKGRALIEKIYGPRMMIVPYVMPGFILARRIYEMTQKADWSKINGIVLLNHGIFSFDDDARISYENMIRFVSKAESYLRKRNAVFKPKPQKAKENLLALAELRKAVSLARGGTVIAQPQTGKRQVAFSKLKRIASIANRGCLTPDHIIRTKRVPVIIKGNVTRAVDSFVESYKKYYKRFATRKHTMIDPSPYWAVWANHGTVSFGRNLKEVQIINDITAHTIDAIVAAEKLGGWKALSAKTLFEMEYWELEQAKLKLGKKPLELSGKVAIVTGAASGIGLASAKELSQQGAVVVALDIDKRIEKMFDNKNIIGLKCDITKQSDLKRAVEATVRQFGGLDILVANAGIFPASKSLEAMDEDMWDKSMQINLTAQQRLLTLCVPYLKQGVDPTLIVVASKNVAAPGPGASAYSVAKAGLTQMARVAALELAKDGIRVNTIHPNAVFDTGIWSKDILTKRAKHYKMSVAEYKKSNLLQTEIVSQDVANLVCSMAGKAFSKTTGAQVSIDGGNERVI